MKDQLLQDHGVVVVIKCGLCGTEWEYLRDQLQCTKCLRRPDMDVLRNKPRVQQKIQVPVYCDDCHALSEFWSQCSDCERS